MLITHSHNLFDIDAIDLVNAALVLTMCLQYSDWFQHSM